ncbi:MAG TPA: hypothetical protein VL326_35210 [Kofleriaceae bacterium]|jgi:hypothetical protein|nr:hypothetical protein [Kofleriaceae bacterium]
MWRVMCAVTLVVGCQHVEPEAQKKAEPPPPVTTPADAPTVAMVSDAAALPSDAAATPADAGVDAAPSAGSTKLAEDKGEGACKRDADCELSVWQPGCCTSACTGYAISKQALAARKAKEKCPPKGTQGAVDDTGLAKPCPPPSPCPPLDFLPEKAVCKKGTCTAVGTTVKRLPGEDQ